MIWIYITTFILLFIAFISLFNVSAESVSGDLNSALDKEKPIAAKAVMVQRNKKENFLVAFLKDIKNVMNYMHMSNRFITVCIASVFLAIGSVIIAALFKNMWLVPGFITIAISIPFLFIKIYSYKYSEKLQAELETTMSQITISYTRLLDLTKAIEENLSNINPPLRAPFEEFLAQARFTGSNERQCIDELDRKIENEIFHEWCDGLKKCVENENMMYLLKPSVDKFAVLRSIESKVKDTISGLKLQFGIIAALVFANIPLFKFIYDEWYQILVHSTPGHVVIGVIVLVAAICLDIFVAWTKPIRFKI